MRRSSHVGPHARTCATSFALALLATAGFVGPTALAAPTTTITTFAGTGTAGPAGDNGPAASAQLSYPMQLVAAPGGGYYFADQGNQKVRRIAPNGTITTIAGSGVQGFAGDGGPATAAQFSAPSGVGVLSDGSILVADSNNNRIRKFTIGGTITTVAGNGSFTFSGDGGPATAAAMRFPYQIAVFPDNSYAFADVDNQRIRKVSASGIITTLAGNGTATFAGDGGPATSASLYKPSGVARFPDGGVLIADSYNNRIRRVTPGGVISTVAGTGTAGAAGDSGAATSAQLNRPIGVTPTPGGAFYIADSLNNKVRFVSGGLISTFAGTGTAGATGDGGPAASARLNGPYSAIVQPGGDVLIADTTNHKLRVVDLTEPSTPPTPVAPQVSSPPRVEGTPAPGQTLTCKPGTYTGTPAPTKSIVWELAPRAVTSPTDPTWQVRAGQTATTYVVREIEQSYRIRCREIVVNSAGTATAPSVESMRVDLGVPAPKPGAGPVVEGVAVVGRETTCGTGEWANAGEFTFEWTVDASFAADGERYTPRAGDRNRQLLCRITGSNDVGRSEVVSSQPIRVIATVPKLMYLPKITIRSYGMKPTDRTGECSTGSWMDDFGQYRFQWYREDSPIPGATGQNYNVGVDDLGGTITCGVTSTNPLGASVEHKANARLIPLPDAGAEGRMFTAINGLNSLSSTSMLAVSAEQMSAMNGVIDARYAEVIAAARTACQKVSPTAVTFGASYGTTLDEKGTCYLLNGGFTIKTTSDGVFWMPQQCAPILPTAVPTVPQILGVNWFRGQPNYGPPRDINGFPLCPKLKIDIPRFDPARSREIDQGIADAVAASAPVKILWDLDGDGRSEATCGPEAPILRTIPEEGKYPKLRAILVNADSESTGIYGIAAASFDFSFGSKKTGSVRDAQTFACRTQMDPPPDPKLPCLTSAVVGRVKVEGNLCPVQSRYIPPDELKNLDPDVQQVLRDKALVGGGNLASFTPEARQALWDTYVGVPGQRPFDRLANAPTTNQRIAGVFRDAVVKMSDPSDLTTGLLKRSSSIFTVDDVPPGTRIRPSAIFNASRYFRPQASAFATDQIYLARGEVSVNGVKLDPGPTGASVLMPSEVKEAITTVRDMTISSSKAQLSMLSDKGMLPLGGPEQFKTQLKESIQAPVQEFANKSLKDLQRSLKDKLDIGPFKLADHADLKVKLEKDGTASITASASLPIFTDLDGKSLSAKVDISADQRGKLTLKTINIKAPSALLGPVELRKLDITYDGGLSVTGQIIFGPHGSGIDITKFRLRSGGDFEAMGLKYNAGAGEGIPIGPGVFLTQIGGEFDLPNLDFKTGQIKAYAAVSAGQSVGRGCPAAGLEGDVTLKWARADFAIDARAEPKIACVSFGQVDFHADTSGYVSVFGRGGIKLGPLEVSANLEAQLQLARRFEDSRFQVFMQGEGKIAGLLEGTVKAMVSNKGVAGCGSITIVKVPLIDEIFGKTIKVTVAGGAGIRFVGGVPPVTPVQLLAGIRIFTGCDLGDWKVFAGSRSIEGKRAQAARVVPIPGGKKVVAVSVVGSGGVPKFTVKTQDGRVLDYTNVPEQLTAMPTGSVAMAIPSESRTVIMFAAPPKGNYTIETAPGSPGIADVQVSAGIDEPSVKVRMQGKGADRTLRYDVKRIPGQTVRLVEVADGATREITTVKTGGQGSKKFTVTEAKKPSGRKIVAEVSQNDLPRTQLTVASFSAPNPKLAKVRGLRVKRSKAKATVSWKKVAGAETYVVRVTRGDGRRETYRPLDGQSRIEITDLDGRKERLAIRVVGVSLAGKKGPAVTLRSRPE